MSIVQYNSRNEVNHEIALAEKERKNVMKANHNVKIVFVAALCVRAMGPIPRRHQPLPLVSSKSPNLNERKRKITDLIWSLSNQHRRSGQKYQGPCHHFGNVQKIVKDAN